VKSDSDKGEEKIGKGIRKVRNAERYSIKRGKTSSKKVGRGDTKKKEKGNFVGKDKKKNKNGRGVQKKGTGAEDFFERDQHKRGGWGEVPGWTMTDKITLHSTKKS